MPARRALDPAAGQGVQWLLLGTMAVWGLNLSVVKFLFGQFDPLAVSVARMGVAAAALLLLMRLRRLRWPRLDRRQVLALLLCTLLMVYVNQILFAAGVSRTTATNAALIISLNPLLSALAAALMLRDRLTLGRIVGVALGFGGVAAVILHRPGSALGSGGLGDLMVLGSVATWVSGGVVVQRLSRRLDAAAISTVVHVAGALLLLAHVLLWPAPQAVDWSRVTGWIVLAVLLSGLFATALGSLVWNRALVAIGVARTSLYAYWVPIFGVAFAVLLLGEPLTVWHLLGLAMVLGGTWLGTRSH